MVLCPTYLPRAAPRWRRTDPHGFRLTATAARPASPGWYDIFFMYGGPSGEGRQTYAPDRFLHFEVAGGPLVARTFGVALAGDAATRVLGPRRVGERRGILLYQRPHPIGGQWGDHSVFSWREHGTRYFASLHAWRVRRAAVRTLDRIVAGLVPAGRAGAARRRLQHAHLLD